MILKNADFSGNNIGKISIDVDLAPAVVTMLGRYTKYPAQKANAYAQALNALYNTLYSAGIWSKLKMLSIPAYASNQNECAKSILDGTTQDAGSTTYYDLDATQGLLKYKSTKPTPGGNAYGYPVTGQTNDCCIFGLLNTPDGGEGWGILNWSVGANYLPLSDSLEVVNIWGLKTRVRENGSAVSDGPLLNRAVATGPFVVNYKGGNVTFKDSSVEKIERSSVTVGNLTNLVPLQYITSITTPTAFGLYLFGCASGLTDTENATLFNALTDFYNAII